jgi:hypothetical protein
MIFRDGILAGRVALVTGGGTGIGGARRPFFRDRASAHS